MLLEELDFLGGKVFGNRQDDKIIVEVDGLISFLGEISKRKVGDEEVDLDFTRDYCRFTIMIVGKRAKLENSINPYIEFIRSKLHSQKIETVYVLGRWENRAIIENMCEQVGDIYWLYRRKKSKTLLRYDDGSSEEIEQLVMVLRMVGAPIFQPG